MRGGLDIIEVNLLDWKENWLALKRHNGDVIENLRLWGLPGRMLHLRMQKTHPISDIRIAVLITDQLFDNLKVSSILLLSCMFPDKCHNHLGPQILHHRCDCKGRVLG